MDSSRDTVALTHSALCNQKPVTAWRQVPGTDHTLRVIGLEDSGCLFSLQSHSEAIVTMYTDQTTVLVRGR
ncbi:hypothetical protein Celaphus_00002551 [Cervus elaphus hippelaphus]|uniref:Uncharacterized protein n=1 Tax=Cervus elaphus hippelaphus TaxID=46360 RepID=A0A212CG08_CEREH|nr:hypothetical protein Celaphus_00002551 [Cervus elaphus hippelaphus]